MIKIYRYFTPSWLAMCLYFSHQAPISLLVCFWWLMLHTFSTYIMLSSFLGWSEYHSTGAGCLRRGRRCSWRGSLCYTYCHCFWWTEQGMRQVNICLERKTRQGRLVIIPKHEPYTPTSCQHMLTFTLLDWVWIKSLFIIYYIAIGSRHCRCYGCLNGFERR